MAEAPRQLRMTVTSEPAAIAPVRRALESFAAGCGLDEQAVADVGLCVNEAMANIIRHAYDNQPGRPIEIDAVAEEAGVRISLRDWGKGINPMASPTRPREPLQPGGLGLVCMSTLMDEVQYEPQADGMLLTMTRRRRIAQPTGRDTTAPIR